jgi:hypothetical protein
MESDPIENTLEQILGRMENQNGRTAAMQTILVGIECGIYFLGDIEIGKILCGFFSK